MALLFLVGGVTTLLLLVLPHPPTLHVPVMLVIGATAPLLALAVQLSRHRLPAAAYPWLVLVGTGIVTVLVATAGSDAAAVSFGFYYTWIILYSVLFFSPLGVVTQTAAAAFAYGGVITRFHQTGTHSFTALEPVVLSAVIGTTSAVVALLSRAREVSEIDPLTRVANRRGLDRLLGTALETAPGANHGLIVAMIDVDHFKSINDERGHAAGDRVLEHLATAWRPLIRPGDAIGRIGGDEFLVVLPGCALADAATILDRLRSAALSGVTCSLGAALWEPGESASMLISQADAALYQAKRLGRNQVAWAGTRHETEATTG
jgi:diguanylate cyclase (GGDEF)-like protein